MRNTKVLIVAGFIGFVCLFVHGVCLSMDELDKRLTRLDKECQPSGAGFIGFVCAGDVSAWMEEVRFDQPTQTTPALDLTNSAEIVLLATLANYSI